jgi:hypothetical protein
LEFLNGVVEVKKRIALISCTKQKQNYSCEAQDMYKSSALFSKITKYVHLSGLDDWYILSAKYGLLKKNTVISPYDITLLNMKAVDRKNWAEKVFADIVKEIPSQSEIYFFAGEKYRQFLLPQLEEAKFTCYVPLKGMQIGEQLQYLSNQIR